MSEILKIDNLTKRYNSFQAVDDISFTIRPGEVVGLLGPNGAGKTTTINIILGLLDPTGGTVQIVGLDAKNNRPAINQNLNFSAVYSHLPSNLSVYQNLYIFGMLYGVKNLKLRIEDLLQEFDLEKFRNKKSGLLSSGETSRLTLAKAIINKPCLLLLDEPTASLDPHISMSVREKIKEYANHCNAGVLWTSHNMNEIEEVCDKVLFLSHGKILLSGNPKTMPAEYGKKSLEELFITVAREPLSLAE